MQTADILFLIGLGLPLALLAWCGAAVVLVGTWYTIRDRVQ